MAEFPAATAGSLKLEWGVCGDASTHAKVMDFNVLEASCYPKLACWNLSTTKPARYNIASDSVTDSFIVVKHVPWAVKYRRPWPLMDA